MSTQRTPSPAHAAGHHHEARDHFKATIALAVLGVFVTYVPVTSVSVSLSAIGLATGAGTGDLQWISDAYVIPMAAAVLSAGVFGDLYGRRRVFLVGMGLTIIGACVAGLADLAGGLDAVRVLWVGQAISGLGAGMLLPTTLALIAHAVPDFRQRGKYVALWATGIVVGLALGPISSGFVLRHLSWGWIYAPTGVLAVIAVVAGAVALKESRSPEGRHLDWPGQILATVAVAASIFGVIEGGEHGWTSVTSVVGLGLALVAFISFVLVERRSEFPLMNLSLFTNPQFSAASVAAVVALFSIVGTAFLLSLFLGYAQQLSTLQIGVRLLFMAGVSAFANPLVSVLMNRSRPIVLLVVGLFLAAVGLLCIAGVEEGTGFGDLVWRFAVFGVSMSFMLTPVSVVAINAAPWQSAGMAAATNTALRQYGGALGPAVLGVVYSSQINNGSTPAGAMGDAILVNVALLAAAGIFCLVVAVQGRGKKPHAA